MVTGYWARAIAVFVFLLAVLGGVAGALQLGISPVLVLVLAVAALLVAALPVAGRGVRQVAQMWRDYPGLVTSEGRLRRENEELRGQLLASGARESRAFGEGRAFGWRALRGVLLGRATSPPQLLTVLAGDAKHGDEVVLVGAGADSTQVGAWFMVEIGVTHSPKAVVEVVEVAPDRKCVMLCVQPLDRRYWAALESRPAHEIEPPAGVGLVHVDVDVLREAASGVEGS